MERRKRVVPREICVYALKGVTTAQGNKAVLNMQKSAEVIVAERQRTESIGVLSMTEKGGMTDHGRKHGKQWLFAKR
jgi:hypothetical protein